MMLSDLLEKLLDLYQKEGDVRILTWNNSGDDETYDFGLFGEVEVCKEMPNAFIGEPREPVPNTGYSYKSEETGEWEWEYVPIGEKYLYFN